MISNRIREAFLSYQFDAGMGFAEQSDRVKLVPLAGSPPHLYMAVIRAKGLVREPGGPIREVEEFGVRIHFPEEYQRYVDPFQIVNLLGPKYPWHPNLHPELPLVCIGRIAPGTDLVELLYRTWETWTFQKVTMREDDASNAAACAWARQNRERFPLDVRPLKRRSLDIRLEPVEPGR